MPSKSAEDRISDLEYLLRKLSERVSTLEDQIHDLAMTGEVSGA